MSSAQIHIFQNQQILLLLCYPQRLHHLISYGLIHQWRSPQPLVAALPVAVLESSAATPPPALLAPHSPTSPSHHLLEETFSQQSQRRSYHLVLEGTFQPPPPPTRNRHKKPLTSSLSTPSTTGPSSRSFQVLNLTSLKAHSGTHSASLGSIFGFLALFSRYE